MRAVGIFRPDSTTPMFDRRYKSRRIAYNTRAYLTGYFQHNYASVCAITNKFPVFSSTSFFYFSSSGYPNCKLTFLNSSPPNVKHTYVPKCRYEILEIKVTTIRLLFFFRPFDTNCAGSAYYARTNNVRRLLIFYRNRRRRSLFVIISPSVYRRALIVVRILTSAVEFERNEPMAYFRFKPITACILYIYIYFRPLDGERVFSENEGKQNRRQKKPFVPFAR